MPGKQPFGWRTMRVTRWIFGDLTNPRNFLITSLLVASGTALASLLATILLSPWAALVLIGLAAAWVAWELVILWMTRPGR